MEISHNEGKNEAQRENFTLNFLLLTSAALVTIRFLANSTELAKVIYTLHLLISGFL